MDVHDTSVNQLSPGGTRRSRAGLDYKLRYQSVQNDTKWSDLVGSQEGRDVTQRDLDRPEGTTV